MKLLIFWWRNLWSCLLNWICVFSADLLYGKVGTKLSKTRFKCFLFVCTPNVAPSFSPSLTQSPPTPIFPLLLLWEGRTHLLPFLAHQVFARLSPSSVMETRQGIHKDWASCLLHVQDRELGWGGRACSSQCMSLGSWDGSFDSESSQGYRSVNSVGLSVEFPSTSGPLLLPNSSTTCPLPLLLYLSVAGYSRRQFC